MIMPVKNLANLDDESMDTMDLYKLFEKQVVHEQVNEIEIEEKRNEEQDQDNVAESEGYFNTLQEENDVRALLGNYRPFTYFLYGTQGIFFLNSLEEFG